MKPSRCRLFISLILGSALIASLPGCANYKARFIAKHVLGYSDEEVDLVGRAKPIPFEDLHFDVKSTSRKLEVRISSGKWEIIGFGTYIGSLRGPSGQDDPNVTEIGLDFMAGIPNAGGGHQSYEEIRIPGRKYVVTFEDSKGKRREVYRDR